MFGAAATHSLPELEPKVETDNEFYGYGFLRPTADEVFAKLAHENIQRRTYAVMKGLA